MPVCSWLIYEQIMDFLFGYGLLQPYIDDESVSDIDGTGPDEFSIKTDGQRRPLAIAFPDEKSYDIFCPFGHYPEAAALSMKMTATVASPMNVTDQHRINVTVPPRSVNRTSISI